MLVFLMFLITLILISFIIYLSSIKIQIENIEIERKNKTKINDIKINIYFMILNKMKLFKITINKEKIEKINFRKLKDKFQEKNIRTSRGAIVKYLKQLKIKSESINFDAQVGINNTVFLAYFTAFINIFFSIIYAKISKGYIENYKYIIKPYQTDRFYLKISINCIINIKIANIISMIIKNRSEEEYERTSDRSVNGNRYEQYTRYGRRKHYYRSAN